MGDQNPSGLNELYRDCLRDVDEHEHKSDSTETTHETRIRQRIFRSLIDGGLIWSELPPEDQRRIFNPLDPEWDGSDETHVGYLDELEDTRLLRRGVVGWLAFLYAGVKDAANIYLPNHLEHTITEEGTAKNTPNIQFDFETLLFEAIREAEGKDGRVVTEFKYNVETEPIPENPWGEYDGDELLTRFKQRDPTLTPREIAWLQMEGLIDGEDWEEYNEAMLSTDELHGGYGQDTVDAVFDAGEENGSE